MHRDPEQNAIATAALTNTGSMDATNTVSAPPPFQAPGSISAGSQGAKITPELPVIPPLAARFTAGPGDRGGTIVGLGESPSEGWNDAWTMAGDAGHIPGVWSSHNVPDAPDPGH